MGAGKYGVLTPSGEELFRVVGIYRCVETVGTRTKEKTHGIIKQSLKNGIYGIMPGTSSLVSPVLIKYKIPVIGS